MNLKQLQAFLVVAQERQITAAAKRLYMAQPPLSYQMKQLEKELGVKLFLRNAHGITLTSAGRTFQDYAQQMVKLGQAAGEALSQEKSGRIGTIHLGLISSTGKLVLNPMVQRLTVDYPRVNFAITEANTMALIDELNSGLLDLAIVRTPFNTRGLEQRPLYQDQMVALGDHEQYRFPTGKMEISDFDQQPLIIYRRFEAIFNDTFARQGVTPYYCVKCDDARTAIMWANQGMGIAVVPQLIAQTYAEQPLTMVDYPAWNSQVEVVWQSGARLSPLTRRFINLLVENKKKLGKKRQSAPCG
jgi:DNA-binding transcriptional LysR family regulator